jgi:hypothetical protein
MKIGVLACGFDCAENINKVLPPWIEAKNSKLGGNEFVISIVHGQFTEYIEILDQALIDSPEWAIKYASGIDYLVCPKPGSETELRNLALKPLLEEQCDVIILLDLQDEIYEISQIQTIFEYVLLEKWISWFKVSLKNYVFDENTYLKDPFTPPRIFKVKTNGHTLKAMSYDNDVIYEAIHMTPKGDVLKQVPHKELPSKTIPAHRAFIKHLTWLSNEKSKHKQKYQIKRWNLCSFDWDNEADKLVFSKSYYDKLGQPFPETVKD